MPTKYRLLVNDNIFGLAGSIRTKGVSRAMRYSSMLAQSLTNYHDIVNSNIPRGEFKRSGFGENMGPE